MKTVTILFAHKNSDYIFEKSFGSDSAFGKALDWARKNESEKIYIFTFDEIRDKTAENISSKENLVSLPSWTTEDLIRESEKAVSEADCDFVIFAWADCPFLNRKLTSEIIETHTEFLSEYTFAEGYPYGFSPETVDRGTLGILKELSSTSQKKAASVPVTRSAFYDFLKTDINAFEVETVLSEDDYRLYRFSFDCGSLENFKQCSVLYESFTPEEKTDFEIQNSDELSVRSLKNPGILKTVPGFYNIQLSPKSVSNPDYIPDDSPLNKGNLMETEKAFKLIEQIACFSERAVVDLSYFGDPVTHPDFIKICEKILSFPGLSVFIETDYMPSEIIFQLKNCVEKAPERKNGYQKIMIAVNLDAAEASVFSKIRGRPESDFNQTVKNIQELASSFPDSIYPQFVRLNENENELENFYRFWNEKTNPSNGNLIIQKYNSFCKTLPERKPADLSPVERNVCWHLRRDMNILSNGDVTFCHCLFGKIVGNVFETELKEIWKYSDEEIKNHSEKNYCKKCGDCDEYYTFNF